MSEVVVIKKINEVYVKILCSPAVSMEMSEWFTFTVPGYKFMPAYRFSGWDGKIRLYNRKTSQIYAGLVQDIVERCQKENYTVELDPELAETAYSVTEAKDFFESLNAKYKPKEYQARAFIQAIRANRGLFVSPTASGKSFIIFMLMKYFQGNKLIIVPTVNLVNQMSSDFIDYDLAGKIGNDIHIIKAGADKNANRLIVVSTWQSIHKLPKEWFNKFKVVVGDECHLFKANCLTSIMEKMVQTKYRYGLTGTLDGSLTNEMVLRGLFGKVHQVTTTKALMDSGDVAKLKIKAIVLKYDEAVCKAVKGGNYQDELAFLFAHEKRNEFIKKLALSLKGNTLIIFSRVQDHGVPLYESLKTMTDLPVYTVHGGVDGDEREDIRKIVNSHENSITVASAGTFSTGVNIPNLNNIIFASPSKSRVRVMQSIGRGLRKSDMKNNCTLFDIADDLSYKKWKNYTLLHFVERIKMYIAEQFEFKQHNVRI